MLAFSRITRFIERHQMLVAALQQVAAQYTVWMLPSGEYQVDGRVNQFQRSYVEDVTGISLV